MIDLDKLDASIRAWISKCEWCAIYAAGALTAFALTWVF